MADSYHYCYYYYYYLLYYHTAKTVYEVFRRNFDQLVSIVSICVEQVARKAFEQNLISVATLREAENMMMLTDSRASLVPRPLRVKAWVRG